MVPVAATDSKKLSHPLDIPASATAIIANTTITEGTHNSFLTLYPTGTPPPNTSNINFATGQTIPNLTVTKTGTGGTITFDNHTGTVHVIYDTVGYFTPEAVNEH